MAIHLKKAAQQLLLAAIFSAITSCGGQECKCAEAHPGMTTAGGESYQSAGQAGTSGQPAGNPYGKWDDSEASTASPDADVQVPTKAEWKALVRRGQRRFDRACGNCHPDGEEDLGPSIIDIRWTTAKMVKQIRKGSGKMKPISTKRLPEDEMEPLMAYLATIQAVKDVAKP
ncbi:MAG: cytochrome c [Myxococcales bacterium]|nr:cytochrome c [Myxococcales bacterium]